MNKNYTLGPWNYNERHNIIEGISNTCPVIGSVFQSNPDADHNARLIAAAPDLLEALKNVVARLEENKPAKAKKQAS